MAATRSGGDDLTENWASDQATATQTSKKRKHDDHASSQPLAAVSSKKKSKKPAAATASSPSAPQFSTDSAERPLSFSSAAEQAAGFWQLYLQSKCGKLLTTIEQSASHTHCTATQCKQNALSQHSPRPVLCAAISSIRDENVPATSVAPVKANKTATTDSSHPLTALSAHLRSTLGKATARRLSEPPTEPPTTNQPLVLILCSSAIRCTDYVKALRSLHLPHNSLLKAFAKHIKLSEQQQQLDSSDVRVAVGTPKRVADLMSSGALSGDRLCVLVVDCCVDAKRYSLMTLPGVRDDFFVLYQQLHASVRAGRVKLTLF